MFSSVGRFQIPGMLPPGPGLKTVLDPLKVQRLFLAMGGSPRDIVSLLHNKEQITREIEDAVAALKTPIDIRMLVFHPLGCPTPYPPAVYCRLHNERCLASIRQPSTNPFVVVIVKNSSISLRFG